MEEMNMTEEKKFDETRPRIDREYSTQWWREVEYLRTKGIEYTYAKRRNENGIVTYKYTKTPQLFIALAEYYNNQLYRRNVRAIENMNSKVLPIEKGYIEIKPDAAEKKLLENDFVKKELLKESNYENQLSPEEVQKAIEAYTKAKDDTI